MSNNTTIITVKEARKLLGKEAKTVSDDDLMRVILSMNQIAELLLDSDMVPNNEKGGII